MDDSKNMTHDGLSVADDMTLRWTWCAYNREQLAFGLFFGWQRSESRRRPFVSFNFLWWHIQVGWLWDLEERP